LSKRRIFIPLEGGTLLPPLIFLNTEQIMAPTERRPPLFKRRIFIPLEGGTLLPPLIFLNTEQS